MFVRNGQALGSVLHEPKADAPKPKPAKKAAPKAEPKPETKAEAKAEDKPAEPKKGVSAAHGDHHS